jgi:vacuolar iron transporter family protein
MQASPSTAAASTSNIFAQYDLPKSLTADLQSTLAESRHLPDFLMHFEHNLPEQVASRAITCALTIAAGYFLGGFVGLLPYFCVGSEQVLLALWWSIGVMGVSLFLFGYGKTCFVVGWKGSTNVW